jgi:hypothetical protein
MRNAYKVLVGKREGVRPLGRTRCRLENNIKMDLIEVECEGVDCNHPPEKRVSWGGGRGFSGFCK